MLSTKPSQTPPGCNPSTRNGLSNNKGMAHLLLILLLVAGLSVVGLFLFKTMQTGGLSVLGTKIAANDTSCNVWAPQSVICTGNYRIRDCTYAGRDGKQCYLYSDPIGTGWGPWDKADCRDIRPLNCPSGMTQVEDCISRFNRDPSQTRSGWRCKLNSQPSDDWNYANCRLTPILNCDAGYEPADDCRQPRDKMYGDVGDGPFYRGGFRCRPITSAESECVKNRPNCPSGYGVEPCVGRTVGPGATPFDGFKCVKSADKPTPAPIVRPPRCLTTTNTCAFNPNDAFSGCCTKDHIMVAAGCDGGKVQCINIKNPPTPLPSCSLSSGCSASTKCCGASGIPSTAYTMLSCQYYDGSSLRSGNRCILTPTVPPVTPPVTNTCIPDWGRGSYSQVCCTSGSDSLLDAGYKSCFPAKAGMCHDKNSCITSSGMGCCTGYSASSCGNGAYKCAPTPPKKPNDIDGDGIPNDFDPDQDGNGQIDVPQTPTSQISAGGGGGGNPSQNLTTVTGVVKNSAGKGVAGVNVNVFLGNGTKPLGDAGVKTGADGTYTFSFDRKNINFAIRAITAGYKPAKTSYTSCSVGTTGYENCWFTPASMPSVDFVSTSTAPSTVYKAPTAEIVSLSAASNIRKGDRVSTVVFAKSTHSRIKKVTLYLNPAYSEGPRCTSVMSGGVELYGTKGRWVKVGEKIYTDQEAVASGATTIDWSTVSNFGVAVPCSLADGAKGACTHSAYFLTVNVEDMGGVTGSGSALTKNPAIPVMRCDGNPLGHRACGSTYYDAPCGQGSSSRIDILPTNSTSPVISKPVVIRAMGFPSDNIYPTMVLKAKNIEVKRWNVTASMVDYKADVGNVSISDLTVHFINDANVNGDRNLKVDYLKLGDTVYQTEDPSTYSKGSWSVGTNCDPGFKSLETLHCNGYLQYGALQPR